METNGETRVDPGLDPAAAALLLLDIARERSLESLLKKVVRVGLARPAIARLEFWLIDKGDICSRCPQRSICPDQTACLHLVAGGSNPLSGSEGDSPCFHNSEGRRPLHVGVLGKIASSGQQMVLRDLDQNPGEMGCLEWMKREQVRGFAGTPISYKGEILGVVASFARMNMTEEGQVWRQIFADHTASAVANARAFDEIRRLKGMVEMQNSYLEEEVVEARAWGDLVGGSAPLRNIVSQIDLVAPTDASVLILGETGTGKELVAREIHKRSTRKDKPMIRVNCASIPKELYESEFFGHARGSFTGAIKDRAGRFETAEGGTIFLDEIGEVPLELQSKLLRVLQEKRYERVGEDRTRHADVRVIGATNRDLKREVAEGRFREDLYYRLNVFPIEVPPLRNRIADVAILARHFVELSVKELRCAMPRLTRAGIAKLEGYNWPGNIRELQNVIERAVIISHGGVLNFDLPDANMRSVALPSARQAVDLEFLTEPEMRQRERENLLAILEKSGWKVRGPAGAAELFGVKPTTLFSRMRKMGLKRPQKEANTGHKLTL